MKKVLLIEPDYRTNYPPLGLMKISTYHKNCGDIVAFYKGYNASLRDLSWDVIYITTLFTYEWKKTIETIKFYQRKHNNIKVGGILASLMPIELENETGIKPHVGLWNEVDTLPLDYSFDKSKASLKSQSVGYMTKGCPNRCPFCAVPTLEPNFINFIPLRQQLDSKRRDLHLWDNNVLASNRLEDIVSELIACGFHKNSKFGKNGKRKGRQREIDFNQGLDARLFTEDKAQLLSNLALRRLRFAFDNINGKEIYIKAITLARKYGFKKFEPYVLYNFKDTPIDLYQRLQTNVEISEELGVNIFSFPMCYIPLDAKDRSYVSPYWTREQILRFKDILNVTYGGVGDKRIFFEKAFGKDADEFKYIINKSKDWVRSRGDKSLARKKA